MATYDLREAVNISAMELPIGENEFLRAGVTAQPCIDAPGPRVAESTAHFECCYLSTHRLRGIGIAHHTGSRIVPQYPLKPAVRLF